MCPIVAELVVSSVSAAVTECISCSGVRQDDIDGGRQQEEKMHDSLLHNTLHSPFCPVAVRRS